MTKREFLEKLRSALGNDLSGSIIQENVAYYDTYISQEAKNGRPEEDVIAELGDPWVIAQTIIDSAENQRGNIGQDSYAYESESQSYTDARTESGHVYTFGLDSWWKKLLLVLGIIGVVVVVVSVISGIISLLAPILVPLIVVMIIVRLIGRRR